MPHLSGGKVTGSHTTVIDLGYELASEIEELDSVRKISLGPIEPTSRRGGKRSVNLLLILLSVYVSR
ncbi:MAG: hypothetical protein GF368_02325 [Candidatus Aenigmarchaeota archaeon]|nr:hypothetical protein [Candidatus Aenigmarchaeota archaeon]